MTEEYEPSCSNCPYRGEREGPGGKTVYQCWYEPPKCFHFVFPVPIPSVIKGQQGVEMKWMFQSRYPDVAADGLCARHPRHLESNFFGEYYEQRRGKRNDP